MELLNAVRPQRSLPSPTNCSQAGVHTIRAQAAPSPAVKPYIADRPDSSSFVALLAVFRATGGTARADDLARLLDSHTLGKGGSLAQSLLAGDILSFRWRGSVWIPMFQFNPRSLKLEAAPLQVRAELPLWFDGWMQAVWFAREHRALAEQRPVDLLDSNLALVIQAARSDRRMAQG